MCFGGGAPSAPKPQAPSTPPPPAPVQKVEETKPPTPTPAPEEPKKEEATLKKKETGARMKERIRTGTERLQTVIGQGLNIGNQEQKDQAYKAMGSRKRQ